MKKLYFLVFLIYSPVSSSLEFENSLGVGIKYGGIFGYQANISEQKHNFRCAMGFFGYNCGYDYKLIENVSLGATTGVLSNLFSLAKYHSVNMTYHFSGEYTQGWNISLDAGMSRCSKDCLDDTDYTEDTEYSGFAAVSLGYSF
ncbi:hypothetical protein QWY77_01805 [Thalassotalea ponticola]|uniref:hypothetical protein n=1 Tax=Thalassotalea ponticola TaxID=1523392 RepID=UPI0025B31D8C|nr:hypothetical protein [Thalassotalea ponticola]MDN3651518.1 hypothetical protein [Thalassotalea ponticola]